MNFEMNYPLKVAIVIATVRNYGEIETMISYVNTMKGKKASRIQMSNLSIEGAKHLNAETGTIAHNCYYGMAQLAQIGVWSTGSNRQASSLDYSVQNVS